VAWFSGILTSPAARAVLGFYDAHPHRSAAVFFLSGVGWDAATIFRIDSLLDNAIILAYLLLLGGIDVAATLHEAGHLKNPRLLRLTPWLPIASQFLLGALASMFVFFYSQSASFTETSIYLLLLIALLIGNEVLHRRMYAARLRLALLFFVLASYLVYFVPMVTGSTGHAAYAAGLILSGLVVGGMAWMLKRQGVFSQTQWGWTAGLVLALGLFMELAYSANWIPPVPLALREAGIFHEVRREGDDYRMRYRKPPWYSFLTRDDRRFSYSAGDTVYAYAAVFAPTKIDTDIFHVWEWREEDGSWAESDRIGYEVSGGRDYGYRGYTRKRNVRPGRWRVRVETADGRILARIKFDVIAATGDGGEWKWRTE
jgi:Protein of unknown function (DUF2914)